MSRKPCPKCPFRPNSPHPYCEDGHEALEAGAEPACHVIVGDGRQFVDPMPSAKKICKGFQKWLDGAPGFVTPKRMEIAA